MARQQAPSQSASSSKNRNLLQINKRTDYKSNLTKTFDQVVTRLLLCAKYTLSIAEHSKTSILQTYLLWSLTKAHARTDNYVTGDAPRDVNVRPF